ncbi:MAG: acyl-CoA thioesterase [Lysobacteraceae bacterium]
MGALHTARIEARWRDLDAFNHVNNATYLTYLEEARLRWLGALEGTWMDAGAAPVLASAQLDYRAPVEWPAVLEVELSCLRAGNSSLTLGHRITTGDGARLHCEGQVVLVWIDPRTGRPVPLPAAVRAACEPAGG